MQAVTRVNVEQASKTITRMPTKSAAWGRPASVGKRAKRAPTGSAGVLTMACMKEEDRSNTGSPRREAERAANRRCVSSRLGFPTNLHPGKASNFGCTIAVGCGGSGLSLAGGQPRRRISQPMRQTLNVRRLRFFACGCASSR